MTQRGGGSGRGSASDRIDFKQVAEAALAAADRLLPAWLPNGHKTGFEWKSVNPTRGDTREGSFSINMATGAWGDFASDDKGGDLVSLCAYLFHGGDQLAGVKDVAEQVGIQLPPPRGGRSHDPVPPHSVPPEKSSPLAETAADVPEAPAKRVTDWIPQRAAPSDAPEAPRAQMKRGLPEHVWHYKDADGSTLGFVFRFKKSDGGKEVLPVCWATHAVTGKSEWRWMHFGEPRPLYGLVDLAAKPEATVLVVEGEKCADVARALFPELAVVTWSGGTNAEHKADWSPLAGRKVIIWPDADAKREKLSKAEKEAGADPASKPYLDELAQPGMKAALKIAARLSADGCKVWLVTIPKPGEKPDGWDIADMVAEEQVGLTEYPGWLREHVALWAPDSGPSAPSESISTAKDAAAEKGEESWVWRLLRNQKGEIERVAANVYDVLVNDAAWSGVLGFDEHAQRVVKLKPPPYINGEEGEWNDQDTTHTGIWMTRRYRFAPGTDVTVKAVDVAARNNSFNPIQTWLRGLPVWDGTKRIGSWLEKYVGVIPKTDDQKEYLRLAGGWFVIGMIARAMNPGCKFDYSLILEGEQGKQKSTILAALVGDKWFSDAELDLHNKDSMIALQGKWLFEIAEMGAMARSDEKRQKAFLSRRFDEFRMPFGTTFVKLPRRVVFSGTTNEWEWNKDPTGGRRFWPITCGVLDVDGLVAVREQLFAEALSYYDAGKRYWPTYDEQKRYFDPEQLEREQQESLIDALHDWVFKQYAAFSVAQAAFEGLNLDASKLTRDLQTRIGITLRKLGCRKVEKRNGMVRFWYEPPAHDAEGNATEPAEAVTAGGTHASF